MSVTVLAANRVTLRGLRLAVCKGLNYVCHNSLQSNRSYCLRPHQAFHERKVWITAASGSPRTAQASAAENMSNTYQHELQAACAAVRLAARLCTVSGENLLVLSPEKAIPRKALDILLLLCRKSSCSSKQEKNRTRVMTRQ